MNDRKITIRYTFIIVIAAILLVGCSKRIEIPDMSSMGNITIISREEGSGTKQEFEGLVNTDEKGAMIVATSTNEVIKLVEKDKNAIGYVAFSSLTETNIKMLEVDSIALNQQTIEKGKYPLCRDYVLAYSGELSAVAQDFLAYVKSAGQSVVEQYCVPVKDASTFLSDKSSGTVKITGSTSTAPIIHKLAEEYMKINPNAKVEVVESDSTQGLNDAMQRKCDFGMSSRSLKTYEQELLTTTVIGKDAIAIIVNKDNPLDNISMEMIKNIYDKKYKEWKELK